MNNDQLMNDYSTHAGAVSIIIPPNGPKDPGHYTQDFDDNIRDIGDRIAQLTPEQAAELEQYLKINGVNHG